MNMIMKNIMRVIAAMAAAACMLCSCGGSKAETPLDITGEWRLSDVSTKAAVIGEENVDVYLSFSGDKKFTMYQMVGQGRYRCFSGTWTLGGNVLNGVYADGTVWGGSYEVSLSSDKAQLVLVSVGTLRETDTYIRADIPQEVIDNAV